MDEDTTVLGFRAGVLNFLRAIEDDRLSRKSVYMYANGKKSKMLRRPQPGAPDPGRGVGPPGGVPFEFR